MRNREILWMSELDLTHHLYYVYTIATEKITERMLPGASR